MYADDVTGIGTAVWRGLEVARAQRKVREFEKWADKWKLPINPAKCQVMVFGKRQNAANTVKIFINNKVIPVVNNTKYLGVTFDSKLSFIEHAEDVVAQGIKIVCYNA